jgi:hypothetical protein
MPTSSLSWDKEADRVGREDQQPVLRPDGWFARAALTDRLGPQPSAATAGSPGPVVLAGPDTDAG